MDVLIVTDTRGRDIECKVVWPDGSDTTPCPHIVVQDRVGGRMFLARRALGAWSEVPLEIAAARLNYATNIVN